MHTSIAIVSWFTYLRELINDSYYHYCKQFITFITSHLFPQQNKCIFVNKMYIILKGHAALEPAGGPDAGDASDLPCNNERVDIVAALVRVHSLHVTERLHQFSALGRV